MQLQEQCSLFTFITYVQIQLMQLFNFNTECTQSKRNMTTVYRCKLMSLQNNFRSQIELNFFNLWLQLGLTATGSWRCLYFLLLQSHKLKKFGHSLTQKIILPTHKFTLTDCRHIRLALCRVFNLSLKILECLFNCFSEIRKTTITTQL